MPADRLTPYRAKRDFRRTAEPRGGRGKGGEALRYVVQRHDARRLHYDFRLEWGGVLKSWAVTKGPSLDPADKRLAVEVEDHPLDYGNFEGTIPAGQYGGGTVQLWDRGVWAPLDPGTVDADLAAGKLKFVLEGERLQGGFALVRMRPRGKGAKADKNWLLIKEKDSAAQPGEGDAVLGAATSVATGRSLTAIAKAGTAVPDFLPFQLCQPAEAPPSGAGWVHELKLDGYRVQLAVRGGRAALRTRTGLDWTPRFPGVAQAAAVLPDCVIDGEAVVLDADGVPHFASLQAVLAGEARQPIHYFAFDLLREGSRDWRDRPLTERKRQLRALLERAKPDDLIRYTEDFAAPGEAVLRSACQLSMEGIVSKRAAAPYVAGRGSGWIKTKCRGGDEFVIGGWSLDRHGRGLGALLVGARRGEGLAYLGRVGTGFGAAKSKALLAKLRPLERETTPFAGAQPARRSDVHWAEPRLVAQVAFGGWTEDGLLRHASFMALRDDKPADQVEAPADRKPAGGAAARLTHPERELWPAEGGGPAVTKAMLAEYYERFAPLLLPQVAGRPLSILRTPDGIGAEAFFQRHAMRGQSPLLKQIRIEGQPKPYLMLEDLGGLLALAQISATELHPWGAMTATPELPDRLIFDLDPAPELPFTAVKQAAALLRRRLEALGLTPFPKLSGGKGLHLVVPLAASRGAPGWPEAKQFAKAVCAALAKDAPEAFTITLAKQARGGRIFLDYLRNDRLSTAVAAWSPRARPGAPVARPLSWRALAGVEAPNATHLADLLAQRPPADPWKGFAAAAAPLQDAIKALNPVSVRRGK